jgi:hypothetical protein
MTRAASNAFAEIDMNHGDGGKGSERRPGQGYQDGWDRIFSKKPPKPKPQPAQPK